LAAQLPAQRNAIAEACAVAEPSAQETRLRELFRLWLREGHLHVLIHLIRQFNSAKQE
jgi:hypothetical protein